MDQKKINHRKRARHAWRYLVEKARSGQLTTYSEVASAIGLHHRSASWFLGVIQQECQRQGLPPLQAIVVGKRSGKPGGGYLATPDEGHAYRKALARVSAYDWPQTAPF